MKSTSLVALQLLLCLIVGGIFIAWQNYGKKHSDLPADRQPEEFHVASNVEVAVTGTGFRWKFRYPGPDGILNSNDDVIADRTLYLPPGIKTSFRITSEDYIYILGIPLNENGSESVDNQQAKIREIAVPDMTHSLDHEFNRHGTYDLMVDPLCGFQSLHDPKMGQIVVTTQHDYSLLFPEAAPEKDADK